MRYLYYPGCSLKGTGRAYEESMLAVFQALDVLVEELPDWNCCGATAYMAVDELKAFALAARNLALAERMDTDTPPADLIAPCNACYLVLNKAQRYITENESIGNKIHTALAAGDMTYSGGVHVRHPLDILLHDIGVERIKTAVKKPLEGMRVACYYGCQIVRPYATFDDQYNPTSMNQLMWALGAETVDWPLKTRCCGGSLTGTIEELGHRLSFILVKEAINRGANIIATSCPLCHFNLECYQKQWQTRYHDDAHMAVAYFTQIMGMAFGIEEKRLGMRRLFVPPAYIAAVS